MPCSMEIPRWWLPGSQFGGDNGKCLLKGAPAVVLLLFGVSFLFLISFLCCCEMFYCPSLWIWIWKRQQFKYFNKGMFPWIVCDLQPLTTEKDYPALFRHWELLILYQAKQVPFLLQCSWTVKKWSLPWQLTDRVWCLEFCISCATEQCSVACRERTVWEPTRMGTS